MISISFVVHIYCAILRFCDSISLKPTIKNKSGKSSCTNTILYQNMTALWTSQMPCTNHKIREIYVPTGINKANYVVTCVSDLVDSIYKYDVDSNTWGKVIDIPSHNTSKIHQRGAFDSTKSMLSFCNQHKVTQIQLNNNTVNSTKLKKKINPIGVPGNSIVIDGIFHIFGGSSNRLILRYNESDKKLLEVSAMHHEAQSLSYFGLIYHKSNCLLFGGYNYSDGTYNDSILTYDMKQNKWHTLSAKLPHPMWLCVCTKAIRNNYVLIFGGYNYNYDSITGSAFFDDILIYSLVHKTLIVSKIKCPKKATWDGAVTINDENKDEKIVFGYVRKAWVTSKIEDHYFPTYYLLKLMQRFYLNEFVYLLGAKGKEHWRMSTLDIV